jgi:hypothetical protein
MTVTARQLRSAGQTKSIQWIGLTPLSITGITVWYHEKCSREFNATLQEVESIGCRKCQEDRFDRVLNNNARFDVV